MMSKNILIDLLRMLSLATCKRTRFVSRRDLRPTIRHSPCEHSIVSTIRSTRDLRMMSADSFTAYHEPLAMALWLQECWVEVLELSRREECEYSGSVRLM